MKIVKALPIFLGLFLVACKPVPKPPPDTVWQIKGDQAVISLDSDRGTAIYSIILNGFEYVVSTSGGSDIQNGNYVHGNLVQTAYFENNQSFLDNPTEAGAITGQNSTLIGATLSGKVFSSYIHPAYFEGSTSGAIISPDTMYKRVELDYSGIVNAVRHDVTVTMGATVQLVVNLSLNWYANPALSNLYVLQGGDWVPTKYVAASTYVDADAIKSCTPSSPMIVASPDGAHAVGVYGPASSYNMMALSVASGAPAMDMVIAGKITPGNCTWVISPATAGAAYSFTVYYVMGTLAEVEAKMGSIMKLAPPAP